MAVRLPAEAGRKQLGINVSRLVTDPQRLGDAPSDSHARLILPDLHYGSPNRSRLESPGEEIASGSGPLVRRDLSGFYPCSVALCSGDSQAPIGSSYFAYWQRQNAGGLPWDFRRAGKKAGGGVAEPQRAMHLRFTAARAGLRHRQEYSGADCWDGT